MAIRQIRTIGDQILYKKSKVIKEITPRIKELIADMIDTMHDSDGVGLAAVQVGILKRIVVIEIEPEKPIVFINPEILSMDGEQTDYEACLSVPGKTGIVTRPNHVKAKALDENLEPFEIEGEELLARAICHELDHLDGHIYVEKVEGELLDTTGKDDDEDDFYDEDDFEVEE